MWKKLLFQIGKKLVRLGLKLIYNRIDKNKDGVIDRDEVEQAIDDFRKFLTKIKNKNY